MMGDNSVKKVGVLGAGWLGHALAEKLSSSGVEVRTASTTVEGREELRESLNVKAFVVRLSDVIPPGFFSGLSHLVITIPPGGRKLGARATAVYEDRLRSLFPILDKLPEMKVIFCSSTGVYGSITGLVDELAATAPDTHSGRAVMAAEVLLQSQLSHLTILRFGGLYGPGRHPGNFFGGRNFPLAQADAPVNLVSRADAVSALELALANLPPGIYNVCAAAHPPKGEFYGAAAGALGLGIKARIPGGAGGKQIDSQKIRAEGWVPVCDELQLPEPTS